MLGLGVTNNFNSLNQIESTTVLTSQRRVTVLGEVNYPIGTVTVGSVQAVLHGTTFEAPVPVAMGTNVLTAIYEGPGFTNTGHMATATVNVVISNRLYEHDANGNLTNDSVFAYAWDAANQLTNIVRLADDQRVLSMRYDALGRRIEVTRADESIERYVYIPGTFLVLAVLDGDNEIKELYTHGPDLSGTLGGAGSIGGILADFRPQTSDLRALHSDAMGSIVLVTDEAGAEAARYRYTPFGREIQREGDYEARYRFSSKEFDPETGLVYYGFRHYSPALGRWINRDPLGELGGLNLFAFVLNGPLDNLDPLGLSAYIDSGPFYRQWLWGRDRKRYVPFDRYDPGWDTSDFRGFDRHVADVCAAQRGKVVTLRGKRLHESGAPGRVVVLLSGEFSYDASSCTWSFSGVVTIQDELYNFNWQDWGVRDKRKWLPWKELATRFGRIWGGLDSTDNDYMMVFEGGRWVNKSGTCKDNQ